MKRHYLPELHDLQRENADLRRRIKFLELRISSISQTLDHLAYDISKSALDPEFIWIPIALKRMAQEVRGD